jgi:hypothetical protein
MTVNTTSGDNYYSVGCVAESQCIEIGGINLWDHPWEEVMDGLFVVRHPLYPFQVHQASKYKISIPGKEIHFLAAELSPSVWGFWSPSLSPYKSA